MTTPTLTRAPQLRQGSAPAVGMVIGSCLSLQVGAAFAAQLFPAIGPTATSVLRLALAGVALLLVTRPAVRGWGRTQWRAVAGLGLIMAGMNGSFYLAIDRIPLGTAVTIEFLGPLTLAAVMSRRLRDLGWVLMAAAGIALLGVAGGATAAGLDPVGAALALVAGVFWALYVLSAAQVGSAVAGQGGLAVAMTVGALALLPAGAAGAVEGVLRPDLLWLAAATALLASIVPYSLELAALRRLPPRVFGVLLSLEPAIATLVGWLLLSQAIGPLGAVAVVAVVLASAGSTLSARPRERVPVPEHAG